MAAKKSASGRKANGKASTSNRKVSTANGNTGATKRKSGANRSKVSAAKNNTKNNRKSIEDINAYQDHQAFEFGITIFVIAIISIFLYLSYFGLTGKVGMVIGGFAFGLFGWFAWFLPLFCLVGFVFYTVNAGDRRVPRRIFSFCGIVLSLQGLSDLLFGRQIITEYYISNHVLHRDYFECMFLTCRDVIMRGKFNGGLCGRAISSVFSKVLGNIGACFILFALLLLCLYIFYGVELMGVIRKRNAYRQEMEEISEKVIQEEDYQKPSYRVFHNDRHNIRQTSVSGEEFLEHRAAEKGAYNSREMRKAPRVQSFDLQQLNERMDRMEKKVDESLQKQESPTSKVDVVSESKKTSNKKKGAIPNNDLTKQSPIDRSSSVKTAFAEEIVTQEILDSSEKSIENPSEKSNIDQIPIYRNELNEKFGNKKKEATKNISAMKIVKDSVEDIADKSTVVTPILAKPMNSFAYKEEVTDVTPTCQKVNMEDTAVQAAGTIVGKAQDSISILEAPSMGKSASEGMTDDSVLPEKTANNRVSSETVMKEKEQSPKKKANHGKIGGDNYVSASDTFNALNESKVNKEEERAYEFPPIDLLSLPKKADDGISDSQLRLTASKLQDTLKSFNVNVQMGAVTCGPTVTRYELLPEQGVRVNKITNLADDLKLSLAAASIRIEAPIPGKAAVGIEVPNPVPSSVYFRELLEGKSFKNAKSDLTFAVGKDIAGKLIMADIAKMPHLLIAGATGSGKSVCINTLIMSILYKSDPKDVKLIMIDPKVVELSVYNGIPHLFCPVVTDPKEAAAALNWAVREMMDRYNKFKELGVRNIGGYNEKIKQTENAEAAGYTKMPYLVVIVDEFADLMMVASKEVEDAVCRLAQLARAAGIHLVLATQRPSVNVITGVIKANIPSRIAFSVSSVIDSRTILDKGGAEKLLGKGDMLFFPSGYSEPVRVQGAFVDDKEVSAVVDFLCNNNETPEYNHAVTEIVELPKEETVPDKKSLPDRDDYFEDAGRFVIESERAAAGQLQRRFSIGFNRAGRIIDQLHKAGVVGPAEGTKPRKVLMTMEEFEKMLSGGASDVSQEEMESMVKEMEEAVVTEEI